MRCALFVLFLSAGTVGFGQAGAVPPFSSGQPVQIPLPGSQASEFGQAPWQWNALRAVPPSIVEIFPKKPNVLLGDASIDPKIVRHPSQQNLGTPPQGTEIAQNLFPGLKFQPIDSQMIERPPSMRSIEPLSITWPKLKVHEIPTDWPKLKTEPIGDASAPDVRSRKQ